MPQQGTILTAEIYKEKKGLYVSHCPQIGIASQGKDEEEAFNNVMCDFFSSMAIPRLSYLYHQTDRAHHGGITIMYKVEDFVITIY